jgi:hypothetical protein
MFKRRYYYLNIVNQFNYKQLSFAVVSRARLQQFLEKRNKGAAGL